MNSKKVFTGVLASVLAVSMMVTPVMAETSDEPVSVDHASHDKNRQNGTVVKEATCTEDGEIKYVCSEDAEEYTEVIPAKGHDWELRTDAEATYDAPGVAYLYCKVCNVKDENSKTEIPQLKHVEKIQLDKEEIVFSEAGATVVIKAVIDPEDATDQTLVWESSDATVASVDENGKVTAHKNGTAVITVRSNDGNAEASCKVTVNGKNGIFQDPVHPNDWYYYRNGVIATDVNTVAENENGWWYIRNGKVDFSYTGVAENENGWWRIEGGQVNFNYYGVAENENGWWRIEGGQVNFNYYGLASNENGWWYIQGGQVNFNYNGVVQNENGWWKVEGGQVNFNYYGVAGNENGWWRIEGGQVNFNYYGLASNENGWWYIQGGQVNFNYNGIVQNENGWWKVEGGQVNFNYYGVAPNENGWWRIEGGQVNFNYNGLASNENGWWYIQGGQVNFNYNGIAKNENGWWYVRGGMVDFGYTGTCWYGSTTCQVVGGKVQLHSEDIYVSDWNSVMYGKTLRLFYDGNGNVIEDVSSIIGGNHTFELYVNKTKNMVTVYTTEGNVYIPVKRFICSQGGSNTPEGIFYTPAKYRWQELMGPCWGQWCTRINGGVLFHSVFYKQYQNNQTLSVNAYNKLGTTCSHGCVRLTAGDAKWIYDNCALSTKVVIYSKGGYEPFSKPTAYKLPSWHTWDPTDPNMYWKCQQNGCH